MSLRFIIIAFMLSGNAFLIRVQVIEKMDLVSRDYMAKPEQFPTRYFNKVNK